MPQSALSQQDKLSRSKHVPRPDVLADTVRKRLHLTFPFLFCCRSDVFLVCACVCVKMCVSEWRSFIFLLLQPRLQLTLRITPNNFHNFFSFQWSVAEQPRSAAVSHRPLPSADIVCRLRIFAVFVWFLSSLYRLFGRLFMFIVRARCFSSSYNFAQTTLLLSPED